METQYNNGMHQPIMRRIIGILIILLSLTLLIWSFWPDSQRQVAFNAPGANIALAKITPPVLSREYTVQIRWPERMNAGKLSQVELKLEPIQRADNQTALNAGEDSYPVAELRLEMPGIQFSPNGDVRIPLISDKSLSFTWQVRAVLPGNYSGALWLHLNRSSDQTGNSKERYLLFTEPLQIHVTRLFNLNAYFAQIAGFLGLLLGASLLIDFSKIRLK